MRISYNWLKTHFNSEPPSPEAIVDALIFHSFEVEGVEKDENGDTFLEIKILPDRAHDCLCHLGISREISALCNIEKPISSVKELADNGIKHTGPSVNIENKDLCRRYVGRVVRNIVVGESSERIKNFLAGIGQRPINNVVDSANFVMFEMGQPLHAFDLDKIVGNISVRKAIKGEKMVTLDDKDLELTEDTLVIADEAGPLAIAGVKGGKRAGVTESTKNIFLESANFEPSNIRRTATKLNLRTDASKRFENDYSRALAMEAIRMFSGLLEDAVGGKDTIFEDIIDIYPNKHINSSVIFSAAEISFLLGINISEDEIVEILNKTSVSVIKKDGKIEAVAPEWRLDLNIVPDYVEEIGRIYGYEKIPNVLPEKSVSTVLDKEYLVVNKIKEILRSIGFSEIYGYSLTDIGEVELDNPLASDKAFLRSSLSRQIKEKIEINLRNSLFEQDPVLVFEIGNVFGENTEQKNICIGIGYRSKKLNKSKAEVEAALAAIFSGLNIQKPIIYSIEEKETMSTVEISLGEIVEASEDVSFDISKIVNPFASYKKISHYPRSIRDIALFVPPSVSPEIISSKIEHEAGPLLIISPILFDVFEKKDAEGNPIKKSLAFRLVFQSYEKTLQDEEVNVVMDKITKSLKEEAGFEIR